MRTVKVCLLIALTMSLLGLALPSSGEEKDKPKYTIKEVMKIAHKEKLLDKVAKGDASDAEKKQLVDLYTALGMNKPPKGEAKDFTEKVKPLIEAAKDVVAGKEGAGKDLKKAVQCKACHDIYK